MPLDAAGCASAIEGLLPQLGQVDFPAEFAAIYSAYAAGGAVIGAESDGGDASVLEAALRGVTASTASQDVMAQGFADFWATVALTGNGAHGGAPVSVVNNAAAMVAAFKGALTASMGDTESAPYYLTMITNIEAVVTTLIWTVVEAMPPLATPTPFPEMIS